MLSVSCELSNLNIVSFLTDNNDIENYDSNGAILSVALVYGLPFIINGKGIRQPEYERT